MPYSSYAQLLELVEFVLAKFPEGLGTSELARKVMEEAHKRAPEMPKELSEEKLRQKLALNLPQHNQIASLQRRIKQKAKYGRIYWRRGNVWKLKNTTDDGNLILYGHRALTIPTADEAKKHEVFPSSSRIAAALSYAEEEFRRGNFSASIRCYKLVEELCSESGDCQILAAARRGLANVLRALGKILTALEYNRQAEEYYRERVVNPRRSSDLMELALVLHNKGDLLKDADLIDRAQDSFREAISIWEELGNEAGRAWSSCGYGYALLAGNETGSALVVFEGSRRYFEDRLSVEKHEREVELLADLSWALNGIGCVHLKRGNLRVASLNLERARKLRKFISSNRRYLPALATTLNTVAKVNLLQGKPRAAKLLLLKAMRFLRETEARRHQIVLAETGIELALCYPLVGDGYSDRLLKPSEEILKSSELMPQVTPIFHKSKEDLLKCCSTLKDIDGDSNIDLIASITNSLI